MSEYDDNLNYDEIDFTKTKRGKNKGRRRVSLLVLEGLILVVVVIVGARFLFNDNADVMDLEATIEAQNIQATANVENQQSVLSAEQLFDRALTEAENDDQLSAIRSLDLAIELNPRYAIAYYERGNLNYEMGKYFSASEDYTLAIEYDVPDVEFAYYWRGRSYYRWDDYWQAERDFDSALRIDPEFIDAVYWRGRSRIETGDYQAGIDDIKQAITMGYDETPYAHFFLAKAYDGLGDYLDAINYYTQSIEATVDECEAYACWIDYNNRATSYYRLEMYDEAVRDYTKAIQVNPDEYPLALQNRADAYEQLGEITPAMSDRNIMFQLLAGDVLTRTLSDDSNTLRATLDANDTQAHISFERTADESVTIQVIVPEDSELNVMMLLRDPNGTPIAYDDPVDTMNASFEDVVLPEDGTYTIVVASHLAETFGEFELTIE